MAAGFFLMLREGLEAALVVGIIAAYLVRIGRADALSKVWFGVGAAVAVSVVVGVTVVLTVGKLPLVVQETFEGIAGVTAVAVLTWMIFWMRRHGRAMKGELERGIDTALSADRSLALAGLAFVAVLREGLETTLFFIAILASAGSAMATLLGSIAGLVIAVGSGWLIFTAGVRINLSRFFLYTGVVLVFVSAGLIAFAIAEFGEAGLFINSGLAFDLRGVLPETSPLGSVLAGLFGYRASPTPLEFLGYVAYLIPILTLFVFGDRIRRTGRPSPAPAV